MSTYSHTPVGVPLSQLINSVSTVSKQRLSGVDGGGGGTATLMPDGGGGDRESEQRPAEEAEHELVDARFATFADELRVHALGVHSGPVYDDVAKVMKAFTSKCEAEAKAGLFNATLSSTEPIAGQAVIGYLTDECAVVAAAAAAAARSSQGRTPYHVGGARENSIASHCCGLAVPRCGNC